MKKKEYQIEIKTRFQLDQLSFGWMCPLCERVYSPYVQICPENHKLSDSKWRIDGKKETP